MKQESDASKQPGQQPPGYEQQNPEKRNQPYAPRQEQGQTGTGGTQPYPRGEPQTPPPTYGECEEEPPDEKPPEPCPPLPPPPDLCGPDVVCYGPPEWGDDPCEDLCKEPEEGQPWWKYPCKGFLNIECKEPDPCSGQKGKVPCKACEGLIDDPPEDGKKICFEPCNEIDLTGACDAVGLQTKLEELKKCIATQVYQKAAVDEVIKAAQDQQKELENLVKDFTKILDDYDKVRPALLCREDCLRGFFQKTKTMVESKLDVGVRKALTDAINYEYCKLRKIECCKQTLENDLTCTTDLIRKRDQSKAEAESAEAAFKDVLKVYGGWIDKRFKILEEIQKKITEAQQSSDDKKYRLIFFLFYWKFVPEFCAKFKPEICCAREGSGGETQQQTAATEMHCIGHKVGDWHPSQIDREALGELLCCAWDFAIKKRTAYQQAAAEVARKESQRTFITEKYKQESDKEKFDKTIREKLATV